MSAWTLLTSPNRLEIQTSYVFIQGPGIHPLYLILYPGNSASLVRLAEGSTCPQPAESLCFPHRIEETFVSCSDQRGRIFQPCKALLVLPLFVEGTTPDLWNGKLRHQAVMQHDPASSSCTCFGSPFTPSPHLPSALPAPWVTPLAQGIGEFCPLASELACP